MSLEGACSMKRRLRRIAALAVLVSAPILAEARPVPSALTPGTTLERHLEADGVHKYRAELGAGAWRLVLTQHGGDAVVTVVRTGLVHPAVERLGPFDSPTGRRGTEAVLVRPDLPGTSGDTSGVDTVDIEVRPRSKSSAGRYTITLERLAPPTVPAESAATTAGLAYAAGAKAEAHERYREALSLWPTQDVAGRARTLVALATLARLLGEPQEAVQRYREALPLWRSLGDRENEATTLNRLGLTLDRLGQSAEARRLFEETLVLWQAIGDRPAEALQRNNLCLVLQRQGEFANARACYEDARALFQELGDPARETVVLSNLAGVYWKLGEPERALASYDEALRASVRSYEKGRILSNRALLYTDLGEVEKALADYGRALLTFRRLEDRRMEGTILNHLGNTYLGLGEDERARTLLEQALPLRRDAGDRRGAAGTLRLLGTAYSRLEDWPRALDAYGEALTLSLELEDRRGEADVRRLIGEAHAAEGSLRRAAVELERAVELQREIGDRRLEGRTLLESGKVRHRMNENEPALKLFAQALGIFRGVRDRGEQARTLHARARTLRNLGRQADALDDVRASGRLLEDLRTRVGGLRQRSAFLATRRGVYELHVDLLMEKHRAATNAGHDRQAFAVSERSRSRALLDVIRADASLDDDTLRRDLRAATYRLGARAERQMSLLGQRHEHDDEASDTEVTAAERGVYEALADLERLRAEARRQSPGYAELIGEPTLDAAETQKLLDPGTLLLEIVLGDERGFLWTVTASSFASFELPARRQVEALARQAHADLSTLDLRTGRTSRQALTELSRLFLAPLTQELAAAKRLVVVADGALHYVPFAALPWEDAAPLIATHEVVYLPSASALAVQRRRPMPAAGKTVAVLADPVFDAQAPEPEEFEPEEPKRLRGHLDGLRRLPATRREAEAIAALVPPSERLLALGFDAHRERVLSGELAAYRYVHFATHGLLNARHPELSGIVLSRLDADGAPRNGFLSMDDVYGLELAAELVVLSGCQTALGREVRGEGLLGLSRGFMAAGVPRVVASLWPVRDDSTAELMRRFYRGMLSDGQTPAAALAAAQRSVHRERRWADPYFWAAFVLVGDWR